MKKLKQLYLECKTGAAGDMLMAALFGLLSAGQQDEFLEKMNLIDENIQVVPQNVKKQGIGGIQMHVVIHGEEESGHHCGHSHSQYAHQDQESCNDHLHTSCASILKRIDELDLPQEVKKNAAAIYHMIAQAESIVHRSELSQVHFHEIGSLDAFIDVVGCSLAFYTLEAEQIICSPVCVGNGSVRCAHGILPVPAPATAEIIKGMPVYTSSFDGELLTPTGAAVLKNFVHRFSRQMDMEIIDIGYGFGTKEFARLSCVRAFLGKKE